jgi:hypothetical protein
VTRDWTASTEFPQPSSLQASGPVVGQAHPAYTAILVSNPLPQALINSSPVQVAV